MNHPNQIRESWMSVHPGPSASSSARACGAIVPGHSCREAAAIDESLAAE